MVFERKREPEFRMGPSRKRIQKQRFFLQPWGSKTDLKMEPEIYENRSLPYFFTTKKTTKFQQHFFLDFLAFREARTLKIKPNHCRVDQKRGYHRFLEKRTLFRNTSKSDSPRDAKKHPKQKKTAAGPPLKTHSKKNSKKTKKKIRRGPVRQNFLPPSPRPPSHSTKVKAGAYK